MAQTITGFRSDNRRALVLEAAADLLVTKGYRGTSMRDIGKSTGMLPGSLYYHFASKEALLIAVFEEGVRRIGNCVDDALSDLDRRDAKAEPWARLQIACEAHLAMLLRGSSFARVVVRVLPSDAPGAEVALIALRNGYEARFRKLVADLPLARHIDRSIFRLMLLGAMNHAPVWFHSGGATAAQLAGQFVSNLQAAQCVSGHGKT